MIPPQFQISTQPLADPRALVFAPNVRLTVLTSQLIRMEFSAANQFEDRASQAFWYRAQPVPDFQVERDGDRLTLITEHLRLRYIASARGFAADTLTIQVFATGETWHYGDAPRANLHGTSRTLDGISGAIKLEPGLMSRAGWAVVDDSTRLVFNADHWVEKHAASTDLYFFGYGHAYKKCLRDFCRVAGQTPMIPRFILGNWWSRYWAYTQDELIALMREFQQHAVPLAVCIVDMDWHITQTGNTSSGWTGYTWNRDLFPEPKKLIAWLHEHGLKTALNLHPASGIHPHEIQYAQMARALGIEPASQQPLAFDLADPKFTQAYFEILHHPLENSGVDFWWLDWQQGTQSQIAGLDPLWWLNHLHFYDLGRDGTKRPFIFSRWGGLGNHRYPIGFSGDTIVTWESLTFQPEFTATAANVGYGWWSHDIGGHMRGVEDAELYARWVQFGVFSPILRLHSTNNPYHDRRPWGWDAETLRVTRDAMQLRHALIPYLYTMAWRNHTQDLPLITPMYYDDPDDARAYACPQQYRFGSELLAAPITTPRDADTQLARQVVWLPPGDWFGFFDGAYYTGDRHHTVYAALGDIPVFARAGAIVPLAAQSASTDNPTTLEVHIFPGADNRFELYEDDGATTAYTRGQFAVTPLVQTRHDRQLQFVVEPARGDVSIVPVRRGYRLHFRGVAMPEHIRCVINSEVREIAATYDAATETLTLAEITLNVTDTLSVTLELAPGSAQSRRDRRLEQCRKMLRAFKLPSVLKYDLDRALPALLQDNSGLASYGARLKDAHVAALMSVLVKNEK